MIRNGELTEDAADRVVFVQALDEHGHLVLGGRRGDAVVEGLDADLLRGSLLAPDVHRAGRIVAHEDRREPGAPPGLGHERLDLARDLLAEPRRNRLPVDDPR